MHLSSLQSLAAPGLYRASIQFALKFVSWSAQNFHAFCRNNSC